MALGVGAARVDARVHASVVEASGLIARAFPVRCTLRTADPVRVAVIASRTFANSSMSRNSLAVGVDTAILARADALVVTTRVFCIAVAVRFALMSAATNRAPPKSRKASTDSLVIGYMTPGIQPARRWVTSFFWVCESTRRERVSRVSLWASTHWDVVNDIAISAGSARAFAGIDAMLVHAGLSVATFAVINTFNLDTLREGVARIARLAGADGSNTAMDTMGANTTCLGPAFHLDIGDGLAKLVKIFAEVTAGVVRRISLRQNTLLK